jgi:hypothetical protein
LCQNCNEIGALLSEIGGPERTGRYIFIYIDHPTLPCFASFFQVTIENGGEGEGKKEEINKNFYHQTESSWKSDHHHHHYNSRR